MGEGALAGGGREDRVFHPPEEEDVVAGEVYGLRAEEEEGREEEREYGLRAEDEEGREEAFRLGEDGSVSTSNESDESSPKRRSASSSKSSIIRRPTSPTHKVRVERRETERRVSSLS